MIKKARNITANRKSRKTKTSVDAAKNMEALNVGLLHSLEPFTLS